MWYTTAVMAKELQFKVLIEQDEDGIYVASVPELPGCYTQGKTLEEARKRIKEAIELVLESDKEVKKEKLGSPKSSSCFFGIEEFKPMPKLSPIRGKELIVILRKVGFKQVHQKGSHARLEHPDGRKTTIPS